MKHSPSIALLLGLLPSTLVALPAPPRNAPPATGGQPAAAAQQAKTTGGDLQILLDRAAFSPGVIDGRPGGNTAKALAAFQEAHDLPVTGKLDPATLENLQAAAGGQPNLVPYTITAEDVAGPFVPIPEDMEEKAKLKALNYESPLELLSERFHSTPELLQQLNPGAAFAAAGETLRVPNVRPAATAAPATPAQSGEKAAPAAAGGPPANVRVLVSKSKSTLTVENGDDLLFFAPITAGSEHDPLPIGEWKVNGVSRNPVFHYNPDLFWDADPTHTKATIPAGPNNPVGIAWIDINKEHYGIHGTPEPKMIGKSLSHGCVRMTNWDVQTVAGMVRPGTPVVFEP